MKQLLVAITILLFLPLTGKAQQNAFERFRQEAGDHSVIYSGKTSFVYSRTIHVNHPYWDTDEFRTGTLSYQGRIYTDVQLRYDLYTQILNILTGKRISVQVDKRNVNYFILNGVRFVPDEKGYRMMMHEGEHLLLTGKMKCGFGNYIVEDMNSYRSFEVKEQYTLTVNGMSYDLKKRNSFIKRFPTHKKALKKYAKEQGLDFKEHRRGSFTALAHYAESLIKPE